MPDRSKAPSRKEIKPPKLIDVKKAQLPGGTPMYMIPSDHPEVLQLDIIFNGGRTYEKKKDVAKAIGRNKK